MGDGRGFASNESDKSNEADRKSTRL